MDIPCCLQVSKEEWMKRGRKSHIDSYALNYDSCSETLNWLVLASSCSCLLLSLCCNGYLPSSWKHKSPLALPRDACFLTIQFYSTTTTSTVHFLKICLNPWLKSALFDFITFQVDVKAQKRFMEPLEERVICSHSLQIPIREAKEENDYEFWKSKVKIRPLSSPTV